MQERLVWIGWTGWEEGKEGGGKGIGLQYQQIAMDWLGDGWMGGSTGTLAGWEMAGWVDWLGDGWMEGLDWPKS